MLPRSEGPPLFAPSNLWARPVEPYTHQYESPLGWVFEIWDPAVSEVAAVRRLPQLRKLTGSEKRTLLLAYKRGAR